MNKNMDEAKGLLVEQLNEVLWLYYRTSYSSTKETISDGLWFQRNAASRN